MGKRKVLYGTGVTPGHVAQALMNAPRVIKERSSDLTEALCDIGIRTATEECPASSVTFSKKFYESNGYWQIQADGPKVGDADGTYSFPLAKLLEYGTGLYGARDTEDNGSGHRYKANMSGKGEKGWVYEDAAGNRVFTHGVYPRHFMHHAAEAMRTELALIETGLFDAETLLEEMGL